MNKQAAYRQRQAEKGLVQAVEWIPAEQRAVFRAVAEALRDGQRVTIDGVTSNPAAVGDSYGPETQRVIDAYYASSKAKDPKSKLEQAVHAVMREIVLPQIEAEVRERFAKENERVNERYRRVDEQRQQLDALAEAVSERARTVAGYMTLEEFKLVRSCLHGDREATKERKDKAFKIMERMKSHVNPLIPIKSLREMGWEDIAPAYKRR